MVKRSIFEEIKVKKNGFAIEIAKKNTIKTNEMVNNRNDVLE